MANTFVLRSEPYTIPGYPDWMAALLHARGVTTAEEAAAFLAPDLTMLHDPMLLHGVKAAAAVIGEAKAAGHRAFVYGDYDVDGLCAATILNDALAALGIPSRIYIPDRHSEGYGVNADAVRALAQEAQLLITVDCGIGNTDEIALAKSLGMRVIITDHHTPPEDLPPADAVVHPLLGDYPEKHLSGAGTAWKLASALLGGPAYASLDLAALATIADMVPLLGENRVIAAFGLDALAHTERIGLRKLMEVAGIGRDGIITADRVSFGIAPRLNAAGRLQSAQDALQLLNTTDEDEARMLALSLDALNEERRQVQEDMREQADEMLKGQNLAHARSIVLTHPDWNKGVAGLVAGKLAETHAYPSIVLAQEGDLLVGSGRSAGDVDLYQALADCADHLIRFGGHRQAAGLSLAADSLPAFCAAFDAAVRAQTGNQPLTRRVFFDAEVTLAQVGKSMVHRLNALAPFGMGNPAPMLLCRNVRLATPRAVGGGKHLKMELISGAARLDGIFFGTGAIDRLPPADANVVFEPGINSYNGVETAQAVIRAVQAGDSAFPQDHPMEAMAFLQDYLPATANKEDGLVFPPAAQEADFLAPQGVLLFCRTQATAQAMHERFPGFAAAFGYADDPKAHNAVVLAASLIGMAAPYDTVILCDGCLHPGEAALPDPTVRVMTMPVSVALTKLVDCMRLTTEDLRKAYVLLKNSDLALSALPVTTEARLAALYILKQMELIDFPQGKPYQSRLLPLRKADPTDSPLYRLINPQEV